MKLQNPHLFLTGLCLDALFSFGQMHTTEVSTVSSSSWRANAKVSSAGELLVGVCGSEVFPPSGSPAEPQRSDSGSHAGLQPFLPELLL